MEGTQDILFHLMLQRDFNTSSQGTTNFVVFFVTVIKQID